MSDLIEDLKEANRKGLNPPQNWTHRAIEALQAKDKEINRYKNFMSQISGNNLQLNNQLKAAIEIGKQNHAKLINTIAELNGGTE